MLVLTETAAGYGLFKIKNERLLSAEKEDIAAAFASEELCQNSAEMVAFSKFKDTKMALEESASLIESKVGKGLKKFLKKNIVEKSLSDELAVIDAKLGGAIKEKLGISIAVSEQTKELQRALRLNIEELMAEIGKDEQKQMQVSLAHAMSRWKLKFSPDKVDIMIIQAIGLLDDLDKDLNNFAMRLKEWYGWHFPEMAKILTDTLVYAKAVKLMGMRTNAKNCDFSTIEIPEEIETELKRAAETSYGTEVTTEDMDHINTLTERVIQLLEYRQQLSNYLKTRMSAIAPNLTHLVGELIGARLISHAGSLLSLSKHPASTVQVLGAEKALFRAMKTKSNTPKYGLIYHASLVGKSASKFKGKISRVLAAKMALAIRVDALGEDTEATVAKAFKEYVERKVCACEDGDDINASRKHLKNAANLSAQTAKKTDTSSYNQDADVVTSNKRQAEKEGEAETAEEPEKKKKKKNKEKTSTAKPLAAGA
ncbi:unnamed protein product [Amoebophrya sp. A120]|nr:unnamed protein product [Amoebophrya sp. A120]|eukprot:GSA120T00006579001.1